MKIRKLFVLVLVFIILLIPASVLAHSGRTDGNGGHTDKSTGVYHYHHGYSAHQHPGGVCPYEDDSEDLFEDDDEFITFDDWDDSDYAEDEAAYWEEEAGGIRKRICRCRNKRRSIQKTENRNDCNRNYWYCCRYSHGMPL